MRLGRALVIASVPAMLLGMVLINGPSLLVFGVGTALFVAGTVGVAFARGGLRRERAARYAALGIFSDGHSNEDIWPGGRGRASR